MAQRANLEAKKRNALAGLSTNRAFNNLLDAPARDPLPEHLKRRCDESILFYILHKSASKVNLVGKINALAGLTRADEKEAQNEAKLAVNAQILFTPERPKSQECV